MMELPKLGRSVEILLVEDSPTDRLLSLHALRDSRIDSVVHTVEDGEQALLFLRREGAYQNATRPDLVLLDLNLPRVDGREVLAEIKRDRALRAIPVVVLTTSEDERDVLGAYESYASSYITKPIEFDKLRAALRGFGEYWTEVVTLPSPSAPTSEARATEVPRSSRAARFLLVEDSESDSFLARAALRTAFPLSDVETVTSLGEAERRLSGAAFDVVLADLGLPDAQGLETVRRLVAVAGDAALLVLSGNEDEELAFAAVQRGAQDYLMKSEVGPRSVTRAVRYALDRRGAQRSALQSQRMEVLGQIAGGIAHDFNNLLTIIQTAATTDVESRDGVHEAMSEIRSAADRGARLAAHLLAFARRQVIEQVPIELNELVGEAVSMLRRVLGNVKIELAVGEPARVLGDRALLEQVLVNLALNARDAMPNGGLLTIATRIVHLDTAMAASLHSAAFAGAFAVLRVEDTGTGMPPEVLDRIFEPFFTTKGSDRGTGLGLSTVVGIVDQHRGWVTVASEVGVGSRFEVYLPLEQRERPPSPEPVSDGAVRRSPQGGRVLLVDDEPLIRRGVNRLLRQHGYEVEVAASAADALVCWQQRGPFDLLLTDVRMGDAMGGTELTMRVRAITPGAPVLLCSGFSDEATERVLQSPRTRFLAKPYRPSQLIEAIEALIAGDDS